MTMRTYPAKVCTICGKAWTPMDRYQAARNTTCGRACAAKASGQARAGKPNVKRRNRVALVCTVCGVTFERPASHASRALEPTCSKQCNGVNRARDLRPFACKDGRAAWPPESVESCRQKMTGPNNPAWKGGVTYWRKAGNYPAIKYVRAPEWALPMARKDGYIMEHRLVMATMAGRLLTRAEVVHHVDHDPTNNDPGNLELYPSNGSHKAAEHGRLAPGVTNRWHPRSPLVPLPGTTEAVFPSP